MSRWRFVVLSIPLLALTCAAQDVPPPPKPQDNGPSIEVTMRFIQDNAAEGKLTYTAYVSDPSQPGVEWNNQFQVETSNLVADPKACRISYHWFAQVNGKVSYDADYNLELKDVRDMVLLPQDQNQHQIDMRNGHPTWSSRIDPNLFTLVVRRPRGVENVFLFSDQTMAVRVAKAITHAVDLCGGGNKEPF
jgi:hypothetical protein